MKLAPEYDGAKLINGVLVALPEKLEQNKINEDNIHSSDQAMSRYQLLRELFLKKAGYFQDFQRRWLPACVAKTGRGTTMLEVAGGLCYIAAIMKNESPDTEVIATDVSPQYLMKKSVPLAQQFFDRQPDHFVAADAEHLPFSEDSIDLIWTHSSMHHFTSVPQFLNEAMRVLRKDGALIACDTADPWLTKKRFGRKKRARAATHGILENSYSMREWRLFAREHNLHIRYDVRAKVPRWLIPALNAVHPAHIVITNNPLILNGRI